MARKRPYNINLYQYTMDTNEKWDYFTSYGEGNWVGGVIIPQNHPAWGITIGSYKSPIRTIAKTADILNLGNDHSEAWCLLRQDPGEKSRAEDEQKKTHECIEVIELLQHKENIPQTEYTEPLNEAGERRKKIYNFCRNHWALFGYVPSQRSVQIALGMSYADIVLDFKKFVKRGYFINPRHGIYLPKDIAA